VLCFRPHVRGRITAPVFSGLKHCVPFSKFVIISAVVSNKYFLRSFIHSFVHHHYHHHHQMTWTEEDPQDSPLWARVMSRSTSLVESFRLQMLIRLMTSLMRRCVAWRQQDVFNSSAVLNADVSLRAPTRELTMRPFVVNLPRTIFFFLGVSTRKKNGRGFVPGPQIFITLTGNCVWLRLMADCQDTGTTMNDTQLSIEEYCHFSVGWSSLCVPQDYRVSQIKKWPLGFFL